LLSVDCKWLVVVSVSYNIPDLVQSFDDAEDSDEHTFYVAGDVTDECHPVHESSIDSDPDIDVCIIVCTV